MEIHEEPSTKTPRNLQIMDKGLQVRGKGGTCEIGNECLECSSGFCLSGTEDISRDRKNTRYCNPSSECLYIEVTKTTHTDYKCRDLRQIMGLAYISCRSFRHRPTHAKEVVGFFKIT